MIPRKRVEAVLRGEVPDKIPFTVYPNHLPPSSNAREQLRDEGVCVVKSVSVFTTHSPNVRVETHSYTENGVNYVKRIIHTPLGDLFAIDRPAGFTTWHVSKIFKKPEDYKLLLFMVKDQQFEPNYEPFIKAQRESGDDVILRTSIAPTPLHQIMIKWMGVETFAIEWSERRDEVEKLYDAISSNHRKIYPIVAQSPAFCANYGGNETGDVMGRERFAKYVIPLHNEAAFLFHKHGKLLGTHLDGNNKVWADLVASSDLDYIEAFTPAPHSDMTMTEAFETWRDKTLWINFPSAVHLSTPEEIEETTRQIIYASASEHRLIIGTTEWIPKKHREKSLLAIARVINREGILPLKKSNPPVER